MGVYFETAILIFTLAILGFIVAVFRRDNSIADVAWGLFFVLLSQLVFWRHDGAFLLMVLVTIWGLRLSIHLAFRNARKGEDWRYQKWREEWKGIFYVRSFFQVFVLQGIFLWVIALPIIRTQGDFKFSLIGGIGLLLWLFGFIYEIVADWQLMKFKSRSEKRGLVMMEGLWKYSRHPNYFGEICVWWGVFLVSLMNMDTLVTWDTLLNLISPLTITFLLVKVSGVPMLEQKYKHDSNYQKYIATTNSLLPKIF